MKILIVDDYPLMVSKLTELLEEVTGITTIKSAGSYTEASNILKTYNPDVALLDIDLPDTSGIELLKHIKSISPETKVIMVTNEGSDYVRTLCLSLGAYAFIDKSLNINDIPTILSKQ